MSGEVTYGNASEDGSDRNGVASGCARDSVDGPDIVVSDSLGEPEKNSKYERAV
jgi:hypothetical protein